MGAAVVTAMVWLSPAAVSERLDIAVGTLANWRSQSTPEHPVGPAFVKLGRLVRYEESAVAAWQQSMTPAVAS